MSSATVTQRYFAAEALSCSTLCKMYLVFRGLTFLVLTTWHLEGLDCIAHCSRHARSVCRNWPSVVELSARYTVVSSAKGLTLDLSCSGRSFMYASLGRVLDRESSPVGRQRRLEPHLR